jgi:hypothetical protein
VTTDEASLYKCGVRECAILKTAIHKIARQVCVLPLEFAVGENASLEPRVGVDVEVKKPAIIPTRVGESSAIESSAVEDGSGNGCTCGNDQLRVLNNVLSDSGKCSRHVL